MTIGAATVKLAMPVRLDSSASHSSVEIRRPDIPRTEPRRPKSEEDDDDLNDHPQTKLDRTGAVHVSLRGRSEFLRLPQEYAGAERSRFRMGAGYFRILDCGAVGNLHLELAGGKIDILFYPFNTSSTSWIPSCGRLIVTLEGYLPALNVA